MPEQLRKLSNEEIGTLGYFINSSRILISDEAIQAVSALATNFENALIEVNVQASNSITDRTVYLVPVLAEVAIKLISEYVKNPATYLHAFTLLQIVQTAYRKNGDPEGAENFGHQVDYLQSQPVPQE